MARLRKRVWKTPSGASRKAWQVDWHDSQGRRRSKQFRTKEEAIAWIETTNLEAIEAHATAVTFADAAHGWLDRAVTEGLERVTVDGYRWAVDGYLIPHIGDVRLDRLDQKMLVELRKELIATRSEELATRILSCARMILTHAQQSGLTEKNVGQGMRTTKSSRHKKRPTIPSRGECRLMLGVYKSARKSGRSQAPMRQRNELLFKMMFEIGIRPCEVRALGWDQVDLVKGEVDIMRDANKYNEIRPCKTRASYRIIPISPVLTLELRAWRKTCPFSAHNLVFPTRAGQVIGARNLNREFSRLQIKAGLAVPVVDRRGQPCLTKRGKPKVRGKYRLYDVRHAAASWWIYKRVDLKKLTTWMAHSSIQITFDTYGHLIEDTASDQAVMAALAADLYEEVQNADGGSEQKEESELLDAE